MKECNLKQVPEVGKIYHFWDDGKTSDSRHYLARCDEIIYIKDARNIKVKRDGKEMSLLDIWISEKTNHPWIMQRTTDYIIKCSIPVYDNDPIYFARSTDGGWFSMNVTGWWQSGILDIDDSIYNSIIDECYNNGWDYTGYTNAKYENII